MDEGAQKHGAAMDEGIDNKLQQKRKAEMGI